MNFVIEKGVPLPKEHRGGFSAALRSMEVGDSLRTPEGMNRGTVSATISRVGRNNGARFATRTVDGVLRVWRVA